MQRTYRGPAALWRVVRALSPAELRLIRRHLHGTRLVWLLKALRHMPVYNEALLQQAFRRKFPRASSTLLRTYKRLLWDVLEANLPPLSDPYLLPERRIWQRLWLSTYLWRKGLSEEAETIWQQALEESIQLGWYEIALWALSLLELYTRDLSHLAPEQRLSDWTRQILHLLTERYKGLVERFSQAERNLHFRVSSGIELPPLPLHDAWGAHLRIYGCLYSLLSQESLPEALSSLSGCLARLFTQAAFPPLGLAFHQAVVFVTILGLLAIGERGRAYEEWRSLWEQCWQKKCWPNDERFQSLWRFGQAIHFMYLVQKRAWEQAYRFWQQEAPSLEAHIFYSAETLANRTAVATAIYLVLILKGSVEERRLWAQKVRQWLPARGALDIYVFWWHFVEWYDAYRRHDYPAKRRTFRHLMRLYRRYFSEQTEWLPILRILRSLTEGLAHTARRRISKLLSHWQAHPEEGYRWNWYMLPFPMPLFLEGILKRSPLEYFPPQTSPESLLSPALIQHLDAALDHIRSALNGQR